MVARSSSSRTAPDYARAVKTMLDYPDGDAAFAVTHFTKLADALDYVPTSDACCLLLDLNLPDAKRRRGRQRAAGGRAAECRSSC